MTLRTLTARIPLEAWIWSLALVGLATLGSSLEGHLTFCIPSWLGLDFCWGCGLGRSIGHAFHGDLAASWQAHPLGLITIGVLIGRIVQLVQQPHTISRG